MGGKRSGNNSNAVYEGGEWAAATAEGGEGNEEEEALLEMGVAMS